MHSQTNSRKTHQGGRNRLHLLLFLLVIGLLLLPGVAVPVQLPVHLFRLPEVSATIDSLQFLFCEYNFLSFFYNLSTMKFIAYSALYCGQFRIRFETGWSHI